MNYWRFVNIHSLNFLSRKLLLITVFSPGRVSHSLTLAKICWGKEVISPYDENSKVYKCSRDRYRCANTGRDFNVRTGTLFENTKIELRTWFLAIYIITSHKKGISSLQLSKDLDVTLFVNYFCV